MSIISNEIENKIDELESRMEGDISKVEILEICRDILHLTNTYWVHIHAILDKPIKGMNENEEGN